MKKIRKSGNEIKKEIELIFQNAKTKKDLNDKIKIFFKNITGKELINHIRISSLFTGYLNHNPKYKQKLDEESNRLLSGDLLIKSH